MHDVLRIGAGPVVVTDREKRGWPLAVHARRAQLMINGASQEELLVDAMARELVVGSCFEDAPLSCLA
ncbi:hypothetical protein PR202_ga16297 [Eleusine coracana subsp. coracana]|uniref:Uncharacterized protein n=1 Tax=Eleusine coracana subsp. coracana TaxID=191504 RepID=A0AAV5CM14_ELECO|nr:hypothetical protein PR202_ga16297 [Eleusine coracana subsp. coracana]